MPRYIRYGMIFLITGVFSADIFSQTISGRIFDALGRMPVHGAVVTLLESGINDTTDLQGCYLFENVEPGTYTVRVEAVNYLKTTKKVMVKSRFEIGSSNLAVNFEIYNIAANAESSRGAMVANYFFPGHGTVEIGVYDEKGKKVRAAVDRSGAGGKRTFSWDGRNNAGAYCPPGTYSCRIRSRNMVTIRQFNWQGIESNAGSPGINQESPIPSDGEKPIPAQEIEEPDGETGGDDDVPVDNASERIGQPDGMPAESAPESIGEPEEIPAESAPETGE